jgi:acyl carrier protein
MTNLDDILGDASMAANRNDTQDRILVLVQAILDRNSIVTELAPATRLADIGLASVDMVNLMLGVEAEFDLTIPQCEITPDNFRSVQMIERMIARQLHAAA